jgi:hypothetical protein
MIKPVAGEDFIHFDEFCYSLCKCCISYKK